MVTAKEVTRVMEDAYSGIGGVQVSQPSGYGSTGVGTTINADQKSELDKLSKQHTGLLDKIENLRAKWRKRKEAPDADLPPDELAQYNSLQDQSDQVWKKITDLRKDNK